MSEQQSTTNQTTQKSARGFILTTVDTVQDAQAVQQGEQVKLDISPILAADEQTAIKFLESKGKVVLSIVPLELLELQTSLLYELAKNENVEILREQVFTVQNNS